MDFTLLEEHRMLQDTVRRFVRQELLALEPLVLCNQRFYKAPLTV